MSYSYKFSSTTPSPNPLVEGPTPDAWNMEPTLDPEPEPQLQKWLSDRSKRSTQLSAENGLDCLGTRDPSAILHPAFVDGACIVSLDDDELPVESASARPYSFYSPYSCGSRLTAEESTKTVPARAVVDPTPMYGEEAKVGATVPARAVVDPTPMSSGEEKAGMTVAPARAEANASPMRGEEEMAATTVTGVGEEDEHSVVTRRREGSLAPSEDHRGHRQADCCSQLGYTILRILRLMSRDLASTLCELFIPIIFVIGTIILWLIFPTEKYYDTTYISETTPALFTVAMATLRSEACYNASVGTIPGLAACPDPADIDPEDPYHCAVGRGVPPGFCYPALQMMNYTLAGFLLAGTTATVPTLDDIVFLQWVAMDDAVPSLSSSAGTNVAFRRGGKLHFAPDTPETKEVVEMFRASSQFFDVYYGGTYATVEEAEKHVKASTHETDPNWGIIQINSFTKDNFDVAIRLNASALPSTESVTDEFYLGGNSTGGNDLYLQSGFITMQTMISDYYMTTVQGQPEGVGKTLSFMPMPTVAFKISGFIAYGSQLAPLILVLGFLYPVSQMTKRIVVEKELRMREAMLIMGLSEAIMYLAYAIVYMVQYFFVSLIIAILLKVTYLPKTSFGYPFFLFLFFSFSIITLSGLIASVFSKARLAAIIAPILYFVLAIPLFAMENANGATKTGVMVLSPSALAVGIGLIFQHEMDGGAQGKDLTYFRDDPNFLVVYVMIFFDIFIYLIIMIYFDLVIPKEWGVSKHPLFCIIDPIKWCCCKKEDDDDGEPLDGRAENGVFETLPGEEKAAVQIRSLRKVFHRGGKKFVAVNNLCWSMREGEISVLLGHNGAGKSTTMNMMTGMLEADGGDCIIYGKSVRHQLREARQEIGLCPQHNILWPKLTCREHLEYFSEIKGLDKKEKEAAVLRMLAAVDLLDKEHYFADDLSGGQKRKLSVAIAFVGGSRLVFLDEPTAGMDVGARRHTWGLLREMSKDHTILLTTHFMDEADLLGSTIGIMSHGRLQCSGTNMFLKSQLGLGFILTLSVVAHVDPAPIEELVHRYVPGAEKVGSGAGEIAYRLPKESKSDFPQLLAELEENDKKIGVNAYSISATTLEEIFLRIAEGIPTDEDGVPASSLPVPEKTASDAVWSVEIEEGKWMRLGMQFRAMMIKRFWNSLRDRRTQFFQIVCPVLCVLLAMLLMLVKFWTTPPIDLDSDMYGATVSVPIANCENRFAPDVKFAPNAITEKWPFTAADGVTRFSNELQRTYKTHTHERYGAIFCDGVSLLGSPDPLSGLFYNFSSPHEIAVTTSNFYRANLEFVLGKELTMNTYSVPMPKTKQEEAVSDSIYAMMIAIIIMIPFTFIPSTFVGWIVKERQCKARHLQNVSGLNFYIYWITNFLFDLSCYVITVFLVIIVFLIFQRDEYVSKYNIGATIVVFLLYGISGIWMAYSLSFLFDDHSTAQNVVMLTNFIVGFLLVLAISALSLMESTEKVAKVLRWIFRIVPSYCVGEGISNLATLKLLQAFDPDYSPWRMDIVGWPCVYMAIEVPFFIFITLFIDHPARRQRTQRMFHDPDAVPEEIEGEDVDVVQERLAIENDPERVGDLVRVRNLRKVYDNGKVAVRNVTFGVTPGEVFGFLGTNGAGKTTTISILCQEFYPTSGHAQICGYDIVTNSQRAQQCIGYCPQFDACLDLLTVEEHLYLYASVRGITSRTRESVVEGLLQLCELTKYRDTKSKELSGGNRRKLSVAVSLIGGPRVVFLDEPSAGMDPVARRGLWTAIERIADNCAIVLTTHHLEEVEALAHRVAIMVDGSLRCIGDKTHLKNKFGAGFEVRVRISELATAKERAAVEAFFAEEFPTCQLTEMRAGRFTYELSHDIKLSQVFYLLETNSKQLGITDYNVSQTSIEQVFMRISEEAELKEEEEHRLRREEKKNSCCGCFGCC